MTRLLLCETVASRWPESQFVVDSSFQVHQHLTCQTQMLLRGPAHDSAELSRAELELGSSRLQYKMDPVIC